MAGGAAGTRTPVALTYRTTAGDFTAALRVRSRKTPAGRRQRILWPLLALLTFAVGALRLSEAGRPTDPFGLVMLALGVLLAVLHFATPPLTARQLQQVFGTYGELRTVVDHSGMRTGSEDFEQALGWSAMSRYAETPELFVLLMAGKNAAALGVLPKRGLADPADADRLRALLDEHLQRV
ncbi:hypothetical protein GCM10010232_10750 [Streptomyces amakusaensis]|uniref:YcxB family protein n=1 Tax=Streptomyces amakusaensis TaxID=67271 RepID=A0ABW0ABL5_9ACTN